MRKVITFEVTCRNHLMPANTDKHWILGDVRVVQLAFDSLIPCCKEAESPVFIGLSAFLFMCDYKSHHPVIDYFMFKNSSPAMIKTRPTMFFLLSFSFKNITLIRETRSIAPVENVGYTMNAGTPTSAFKSKKDA